MATLVMGASGSTGRLLVEQLLDMGQEVKVIMRTPDKAPDSWKNNKNISIINASISEVSEDKMASYIEGCQAVASCLGHNLTFKGIYGKPRKLVTNAVSLLCNTIKNNNPQNSIKFVLMNTTGNRNRDINEPITLGERIVIGLIRLLVPPHPDNEKAADYLRKEIGQHDSSIEWVAVRPDSLINNDEITEYDLHVSPTRSAIFNPGKTSRINVGHFMTKLIIDNEIWDKWKGQMPVIYNKEEAVKS